MGRPRINPPSKAAERIKQLASEGYEPLSIADSFGCHIDVLNDWFDTIPSLKYAFEVGKELERVALHKIVVNSAKNGVTAASRNAQYILTSCFGYKVDDKSSNQVNVAIENRPVMVVKDHGTDEEWSAKAAAQQAALIAGNEHGPRLEAPQKHASTFPTGDSLPMGEPVPIPAPIGAACADSALSKTPSQWDAPCWNPKA
jgi:hypothetical protein